MNEVEDDLEREERPVVSMALVLGLLYGASFAGVLAAPELPADVHQALAGLSCLIAS